MSAPRLNSSLAELQSDAEPKPQVYILLGDPILENLYRQKLHATEFDLIWHDSKQNWETLVQEYKYDIIVVDLSLFPQNPVEALHRLKKYSPDSEIMVLSPNDDVQTVIAAFKIGVSDYYLKPTNPETISWAISKILRKKTLKSKDAGLNADLQVFSIAHHINVADNDHKMRHLAMKHLASLVEAQGGIWVWKAEGDSETTLTPELQGRPFRLEILSPSQEEAYKHFHRFEKEYPRLLEDSFDTHLTSHPEFWFRTDYVWIPLQTASMGGLLLYGTKRTLEAADQARVEFLIRNLEVSLENYRRYVEAKQLSYIDDLTGLYNSRYLDITLSSAVQELRHASAAPEQGFCVLFIDIDRFKSINDTHGHLIGSAMLTQLGRILKNSLRKNDQLFRYGGDEFIAVLFGLSLTEANEIAERLRKTTEKRVFRFAKVEVRITLSIGIARFPDHGKDKKTIVAMADKAMYHSKKTGRNRVFIAE